ESPNRFNPFGYRSSSCPCRLRFRPPCDGAEKTLRGSIVRAVSQSPSSGIGRGDDRAPGIVGPQPRDLMMITGRHHNGEFAWKSAGHRSKRFHRNYAMSEARALFDQADMRPSLRAKRSNPGPPPLTSDPLDCFVASLLAMTIQSDRIPL